MPKASKIAIGTAVAVVAVVAAAGAAQLYAQHAARTRVDAALAALTPGTSGHYGALAYNLFTGTLRIDNLAIVQDGEPTLTIDRVVLHHGAGAGSAQAPYMADRLRLVGLTAHRDGHSITVAIVDAQNIQILAPGVPLPADTPTWLVDPAAGTLIGARTIVASGIVGDQGATLGNISVSGYHNGVIDAAAASDFADRDGHQIASASGTAIDLDGLDRVFDADRYVPGAPTWTNARVLIGHAEINGFVNHGTSTSSGALDRIAVDGLAAHPFANAPTPDDMTSTDFIRDTAQAVSVGAIKIDGLRGTTGPAGNIFTLHDLALKGYADGALNHFLFDGFTLVRPQNQQMTIGHFDLTGLNASKLLHEAADDTSVWTALGGAGNGLVRLDGMNLTGVAVTPKAGGVVTLASLNETVDNGTPLKATLALRGLSIPAQAIPLGQNPLTLMGIDPLILDLDEAWTMDDATGTVTIQQTKLTARGLATMELSGRLTNLPHGTMTPDAVLDSLDKIAIGSLKVTYTNETLMQRLVAMQAKQSGRSADDVTGMFKMAASFMAAAVVPAQPDAGDQVAKFIGDPKTLTITAAPAAPVPISDLLGTGMQAAQKALNLNLSAD